MTFNAEFLWDGVYPEEGQADFPWKGSLTEAEEHMRRIAEVISSTRWGLWCRPPTGRSTRAIW